MGNDPTSLVEFESRLFSDEACSEYLVRLRWPEGFVCPACGGRDAWRTEQLLFHCACGFPVHGSP